MIKLSETSCSLDILRRHIFLGSGRPRLVVTRGKLSQWLYRENNLLESSTSHILYVSVNANSFCVQCSLIASAAMTRDRVLHYLPRQVKFYSLSFYVSTFFNAINCYIILKGVLLPNTWASQQHKYLERGCREPVASKKMTLGQVCDARLLRSGGIPYIFKSCEKKSLWGICPSIWHHRVKLSQISQGKLSA